MRSLDEIVEMHSGLAGDRAFSSYLWANKRITSGPERIQPCEPLIQRHKARHRGRNPPLSLLNLGCLRENCPPYHPFQHGGYKHAAEARARQNLALRLIAQPRRANLPTFSYFWIDSIENDAERKVAGSTS